MEWVIIIGVPALYFLPSIVAKSRRHKDGSAIFMTNLLAGWTGLGWLIAFVWSFTGNVEAETTARNYFTDKKTMRPEKKSENALFLKMVPLFEKLGLVLAGICGLIGLALVFSGSWGVSIAFFLAVAVLLPQLRRKIPVQMSWHNWASAIILVFIVGSFLSINHDLSASETARIENQKQAEKMAAENRAREKAENETYFKGHQDEVLMKIKSLINEKQYQEAKKYAASYRHIDNQSLAESLREIDKKVADSQAEQAKKEAQKAESKIDRWQVSYDVSKMDDSKTIIMAVNAENTIQAWLAEPRPTLIIRCQEKKTDLFINVGAQINPEYGLSNEATVKLRLDDKKPFQQTWGLSTDGKALFASFPIPMAIHLYSAKKLTVSFVPFNSSPAIAEFDVRGIDKHLPELAKTCGWKI